MRLATFRRTTRSSTRVLHLTHPRLRTHIRQMSAFCNIRLCNGRIAHIPETGLPLERPLVLPASLMMSRRFASSDPSKGPLVTTPDDPAAPDLNIRWFYAIDSPKSMPDHYGYKQKEEPKKFTAFSFYDSQRLEMEFQKGEDGVDFQNMIEVNEDFLFEVDLKKREMKPVYWEGAVYEIRRGTWFKNDGTPVSEDLARDLEKGYIRMKPYEADEGKKSGNPLLKSFGRNTDDVYVIHGSKKVLYSDDKTAYLLEEGYGGALQVSYLKAVKSLPSIGATLLIRGYEHPELKKKPEENEPESSTFGSLGGLLSLEIDELFGEKTGKLSKEGQDSNTKDAMELEIEQDYKSKGQEFRGGERQVDHLIFCIHGIGQMLGTKFQNVNFTHTVNVMRKNLKKVYSENKDFQNLLNDKTDDNCRLQVLPISWRHKVDFTPEKRAHNRLPSLAEITVDEFKPLRNLLGSVLLDILLYYEPHYMNQILDEVVAEANRQYHLFKERNPNFSGKVSIVGHSLGSAISVDLLSMQPTKFDPESKEPKHFHFEVENYFGIGSPVGVFNLLGRTNIAPRSLAGDSTKECKTLACQNYYNIFHPCDPIGFRVEPLIRTEFHEYQPASVPFLIEDFNKQLTYLAQARDTFTKKMADYVSGAVNITKLMKISEEESQKVKEESEKEVVAKEVELSEEQVKIMTAMNYNGRVDYALQQGYLELSVISGVTAHMSYFEDENVAAFLLKETLTKHDPVTSKTVIKNFHD